jgi:hypothetical protein
MLGICINIQSFQEHIAAYNELYPKGELVMVDNYRTTEVDIFSVQV